MPFKVVSGVGRGIGVLDGVVIIRAEGAVLGVNVGRPIVTSGPLLHSCVEVHEPIELSFGMVSGVGPGIDRGPRASRGRDCFWDFFGICTPIHLNGQNDVLFAEKCI